MTNSRRKGHSFEREVAIKLKSLFPNARRKLEYHISQCTGVDLEETGVFRIQCKRSKTSVPMNKIKEIKDEGIHVLWTKVDRERDMVTLYAEDFLRIVEKLGAS